MGNLEAGAFIGSFEAGAFIGNFEVGAFIGSFEALNSFRTDFSGITSALNFLLLTPGGPVGPGELLLGAVE